MNVKIRENLQNVKDLKCLEDLFYFQAKEKSLKLTSIKCMIRISLTKFNKLLYKNASSITNNDIKKWYNNYLKLAEEKNYYPINVKKTIALMKNLLTLGIKKNIVNETLDLDILDNSFLKDNKNALLNENYLTEEEMKFTLSKIDELSRNFLINKEEIKFIISFLFYTGLRVNEFTALKISDFEIEK